MKYQIGNRVVTKDEYNKIKSQLGSAKGSGGAKETATTKEVVGENQKRESELSQIKQDIKSRTGTAPLLTPGIVGEEKNKKIEAEKVFDSAQNPTQFKEFPTERPDLIKEFNTPEGQLQVAQEVIRRSGTQATPEETFKLRVEQMSRQQAIVASASIKELANKIPYFGELITKEKKNVDSLKQELGNQINSIDAITSMAIDGTIDRQTALDQLTKLEQDVFDTQETIQQRIILSPTLRKNGDVGEIETKLYNNYIKIFNARKQLSGII